MENMKLGQKRVQRNFNPSKTCNSISDPLLSASTTTFINQCDEATLVETNVLEDSIEMIYEETSNIISSVYPSLTPEKIHFKIVFSCVNGKWNKSERIYGKKIEGFSYFESEQQDKFTSNKPPIASISDTNIMNIKISILNKFNTELSVYSTDLDSYELNKKHNISIERSIDQMIHKIHFEQNLNEKNTEISNKSDSKKSAVEFLERQLIKIGLDIDKNVLKLIRKSIEQAKEIENQQQDKNKYSEEELKSAFRIGFSIGYGSTVQELDLKNEYCEKWFEKFKNK